MPPPGTYRTCRGDPRPFFVLCLRLALRANARFWPAGTAKSDNGLSPPTGLAGQGDHAPETSACAVASGRPVLRNNRFAGTASVCGWNKRLALTSPRESHRMTTGRANRLTHQPTSLSRAVWGHTNPSHLPPTGQPPPSALRQRSLAFGTTSCGVWLAGGWLAGGWLAGLAGCLPACMPACLPAPLPACLLAVCGSLVLSLPGPPALARRSTY